MSLARQRTVVPVERIRARHGEDSIDGNGLPRVSRSLLRVFGGYSRFYLARHFHTVRISRDSFRPGQTSGSLSLDNTPLVIFANHASWWDPLVCLLLQSAFLGERRAFAPIDALALARYRFFRKLGFFGVEQDSPRGAVQFLRTSSAILKHPGTVLWLTPQGRFSDARERPVRIKDGLGHLAARTGRADFIPLAIEYAFWEERLPEVLVRFGDPIHLDYRTAGRRAAGWWTALFEQRLQQAQDELAIAAQRRKSLDFEVLMRGGSGVNFFYDAWRRLRGGSQGQPFRSEHGQL